MTDTKISQEIAAAPLDGTELTEVVQAGNNRKATTQNIANLALPLGTTGSGPVVLRNSATLNSPTFAGAVSGAGTVPNTVLQNSSVIIAGHAVSLGGSQNLAASDLTNGTTGSGGEIVLADAPTIIAPILTDVDISGGSITDILNPVNPQDVATKSYVDSVVSGLTVHTAVSAATTTALPNSPTYSNGSSGIGATLTAGSNAALTVDGYAVQTNDRLLIKNQVAPANDGVYVATNPGSGGAPYVLTRASDFDQFSNITPDSYFFVENGSTNAASGWLMTTGEPITVGTTAIAFTQFSASSQYLAGSGLTLSGNTFSLTNSSVTIAGHTIALGGSQNLAASDLANGTTGSGAVVLTTSPTISFTAPGGASSATLASRFGHVLNAVDDFGADPTGASNSASHIQSAVNAAIAAGVNLFIPPGIYDIAGGTIIINGPLRMFGAGRLTVFRRSVSNGTFPMIYCSGDYVTCENFRCTFTAGSTAISYYEAAVIWENGAGPGSGHPIEARALDLIIDGPFYTGLMFSSVRRGWMSRCSVKGVINRGFYAYQNSTDIIIADCEADGASAEGSSSVLTEYGFNVNPAGNSVIQNLVIGNCIAKNCQGDGFVVGDRTINWTVSGCTAYNCGNGGSGVGFVVEFANGFNAEEGTITGCTALDCYSGFYVTQGFYINLSGCRATGCLVDGFLVADSQYVAFSGCISHTNSGNGFNVVSTNPGECIGVSISGCQAIGNAADGIFTSDNADRCLIVGNIAIANGNTNITINGTNMVNANNLDT